MSLTVLLLVSGIACAQAPTAEPAKAPEATAAEKPANEESPAASTAKPKTTGTRAIPKLGVKEAKALCKKDGEKGRALSTCIQDKINSQ